VQHRTVYHKHNIIYIYLCVVYIIQCGAHKIYPFVVVVVVMYYKSRALAVNIPIWATSRGGRRVAQYYYYADRPLYIILLYTECSLCTRFSRRRRSASKAKLYCVRKTDIGFCSARNACICCTIAVWCSRTNQIIHLLLKTRA